MSILFTDNGSLADKIDEMHGTLQESVTKEGLTASVQVKVPWADRYTIIDDIIGLRRTYPYAPSSGAVATTGGSRPFGGSSQSTQGLSYEHAIVTINYEQRNTETFAGTVYSESVEPSAEFLTLDHNDFRWGAADGDEVLETEAPGRLETGFDYVQNLYELSSIPNAVLSTIGHVNQSFHYAAILGFNFPPETLLYVIPSTSRELDSQGNGKWKLTLRTSFKPNGWNKYWRAKNKQYESIYIAGGDEYKNYPLSGSLPII